VIPEPALTVAEEEVEQQLDPPVPPQPLTMQTGQQQQPQQQQQQQQQQTSTPLSSGSSTGLTQFPGRPRPPAPVSAPVTFALPSGEASVEVRDTTDRGKVLASLQARDVGEVVLVEEPALAVLQASPEPTVADLQKWVDGYAALTTKQQTDILQLCCPTQAAQGGALANLLGRSGEQASMTMRCPPVVSPEELWQFLRIVECNTFQVAEANGYRRVELLVKISRVNHSCLPNTLRGPGSREGTVELRTIRPVAEGEELTISYVDEDTLTSSCSARQDRLFGRWQFHCGCTRCSSPDSLRAFRCPAKPPCRKGLALASADGNSVASCSNCGSFMNAKDVAETFDAELTLKEGSPQALREAQVAAGNLQAALDARDGPAFEKASEEAMKALGRCSAVAAASPRVHPHHHLVSGIAKAAASLRALLGDGLAAGKRGELAKDMWGRATSELQEAISAEHAALPVPRDGRIADLIGLGGLHRRLGQTDKCKAVLSEALAEMRAIYWAAAPAERSSSTAMLQGVERAIAEL